jgi:phasin family protein
MNNTAEQFIASNKDNLQAIETAATQAYASVEKLVELNMAASKAALSESFSHLQASFGVKTPQEFMALQTAYFKPVAEKSAAYLQHVQTIAADSGAGLTQSVEGKIAEAKKAFEVAIENLEKNAPAGTETAVAAFRNALTTGQKAVESAQASAKKAVETAQSNFTAVSKQAMEAAKKVAKVA